MKASRRQENVQYCALETRRGGLEAPLPHLQSLAKLILGITFCTGGVWPHTWGDIVSSIKEQTEAVAASPLPLAERAYFIRKRIVQWTVLCCKGSSPAVTNSTRSKLTYFLMVPAKQVAISSAAFFF